MNPKQVPSPTEIIEKDSLRWENAIYTTLPGSKPPLASSNFTALDQGASSIVFLVLGAE
jgi:protein transport protein SEC24